VVGGSRERGGGACEIEALKLVAVAGDSTWGFVDLPLPHVLYIIPPES